MIKRVFGFLIAWLFIAYAMADSPYPSAPLYLTSTLSPNVMLILDTSASMFCPPGADIDTIAAAHPNLYYIASDRYGNYYYSKPDNFKSWWTDSACIYNVYEKVGNRYNDVTTTYFPLSSRKYSVAKTLSQNIVQTNNGLRWGLFTFDHAKDQNYRNTYSDDGGILRLAIDAKNTSSMVSAIEKYMGTYFYDPANNYSGLINRWISGRSGDGNPGTPLSETFYEVTRYFMGKTSFYGKYTSPGTTSTSAYVSPIQYRCQKNFSIFVTDGEATTDDTFPSSSNDSIFGGLGASLSSYTKAAYVNDLISSGLDGDGASYNAADYPKQNISTYTIGFDTSSDVLSSAANDAGGVYYQAKDASALGSALSSVMTSINQQLAAAVPPVVSNPTNPTAVYQATYDTQWWSGQLKAYSTNSKTGLADLSNSLTISFPSADLRQKTMWTSSGATSAGALFSTAYITGNYGSLGKDVIYSYLSGASQSGTRDRTLDTSNPKTLGDIINSTPTSIADNVSFAVGANDGMLHVFSRSMSGYSENFSYIPRAIQSSLSYLAYPDYGVDTVKNPHKYYVDGSLVTGYVSALQFTGNKVILTGGLGQGGKGLFALDVTSIATSPTGTFAKENVLWDHTSDDSGFTNLGYTIGRQVIAKVYSPKDSANVWAVIAGNGYDSTSGKSTLLLIKLDDGSLINELDTGVASNGLSAPAVLDINADGVVDYVYAGDQQGALWRFSLPSKSSVGSVNKLFQAPSTQPIMFAPAINKNSAGGYTLIFGTGRLLYKNGSINDLTDVNMQTIYGIYDDLKKNAIGVGNLLVRSVIYNNQPGTAVIDGTKSVNALFRETTASAKSDPAIPDQKDGWKLDLPGAGERVLDSPIIALGRVYFTTQIPQASTKVCGVKQDGWVMALDPATGSAPNKAAFDLDADGKSTNKDYVIFDKTSLPPAGINYQIGMPSSLVISTTRTPLDLTSYSENQSGQIGVLPYPTDGEILNMFVSGTGGSNGNFAQSKLLPNTFAGGGRRIAWRELF